MQRSGHHLRKHPHIVHNLDHYRWANVELRDEGKHYCHDSDIVEQHPERDCSLAHWISTARPEQGSTVGFVLRIIIANRGYFRLIVASQERHGRGQACIPLFAWRVVPNLDTQKRTQGAVEHHMGK